MYLKIHKRAKMPCAVKKSTTQFILCILCTCALKRSGEIEAKVKDSVKVCMNAKIKVQ